MNLSFLLPEKKGIPVLMYHKVSNAPGDALNIPMAQFRQQIEWLIAGGYRFLSLSDYHEAIKKPLPTNSKSVLLTFDDGYKNNLEHVYPILKSFNICATIFIVGNTLNNSGQGYENEGDGLKMTLTELKSLDPAVFQIALHGYDHLSFSKLDAAQIKQELEKTIDSFNSSGLEYIKSFAYPYGARPKDAATKQAMFNSMKELGINAAFRIGNSIDPLPVSNNYEINRIDITGFDTIETFKTKLKKGKLKPF